MQVIEIRLLILSLMMGVLVIASKVAFGEESKPSFSAYARSSMQIGKGWNQGEPLYTSGFALHSRLQETQYFELGTTAKLGTDSRFVVTLANGGDSFHYTGTWPGPGFAVRNLYYEVDKLPEAPSLGLWFGSRMYRGNDIYLFDTWMLDNQNILGGGVMMHGSVEKEFGMGVRGATGYGFTAPANTVTYTVNRSPQRYMFINKLSIPTSADYKLKTNLELHAIPKGNAQFVDGATTNTIEFPATYGVALGAQHNFLGSHTLFTNVAYGDVEGAITTPSYPVTSVRTATGSILDVTGKGLSTRRDSRAAQLGATNVAEFSGMDLGLIYGFAGQVNAPKSGATGVALTAAVRPMFYVTSHLHLGVEVDGTKYLKQSTGDDVTYGELSPMMEYALNKNALGSPKFRLIASNAFYSKEVVKYGAPTRYAFNLATGFELWF